MNILADEGSSMEQQKSTDVLLMELMGLALGWEFEGASEHRALVQRLYQAAQEERKATHTRFLHLQERQALCEKEVDSVRAKLADMEAATKDSQHAETGKKTLKEMEGEHSGRRDLKELGPRQRLQGTGVASVPSDSANNSIDVESPSVESSDPRKRQKTGQATSESLPPPPASPPPTVSSATQAQTLATSRKPSMAPMNSELRKNASMPKADCYRPTSATPTGLDPKLRKQRKPVCRDCFGSGMREECDGGPTCRLCIARNITCVYLPCREEDCHYNVCGKIHDDQWESEKGNGLRLVEGKNWTSNKPKKRRF